MYIRISNGDHFIRHTGEVLDQDRLKVEPKVDPLGRQFIKSRGKKRLIAELVLEHHGNAPEKCRPAKQNEKPKWLDGKKSNNHIDNLVWEDTSEKPANAEKPKLSDEHKEKIYELICHKTKYADIITIYKEEHGIELKKPEISKIKKEMLKK